MMNTLQMEYTKMTNTELKNLCKHRGISGFSGKNKLELIALLSAEPVVAPSAEVPAKSGVQGFKGKGKPAGVLPDEGDIAHKRTMQGLEVRGKNNAR